MDKLPIVAHRPVVISEPFPTRWCHPWPVCRLWHWRLDRAELSPSRSLAGRNNSTRGWNDPLKDKENFEDIGPAGRDNWNFRGKRLRGSGRIRPRAFPVQREFALHRPARPRPRGRILAMSSKKSLGGTDMDLLLLSVDSACNANSAMISMAKLYFAMLGKHRGSRADHFGGTKQFSIVTRATVHAASGRAILWLHSAIDG